MDPVSLKSDLIKFVFPLYLFSEGSSCFTWERWNKPILMGVIVTETSLSYRLLFLPLFIHTYSYLISGGEFHFHNYPE